MMRQWKLALSAACIATTPVAAKAERVVNYAIDETKAHAEADEQGVAFVPLPTHGSRHIAIDIPPSLDHEVIRVGISCSAWTVRNPISILLTQFLTAWDKDGKPSADLAAPADLVVKIDRAATVSRCVNTAEMQATCITRVTISGTSTSPGATPQPVRVEREVATKGIGACAGLARGVGVVSRQAARDLLDHLPG